MHTVHAPLAKRATDDWLGSGLFDPASPSAEGSQGRKRRQRNRRKGLLLQRLEERIVFDAAPPVVAIDAPGEALIGGDVNFTVTFDNTATEPAFGPFVDLILPTDGADGQAGTDVPDGIGTSSATFTFLGQTLTPALDTIVPESGEVQHPFLKDGTGAPVVVTGLNPGDRFIVLRLPFGSFEPNQPAAEIQGTANLSNLADLGVGLTIQARGGYEFGADPLNNPTVDDPSLLLGNFQDAVVEPTLVTLNKVYVGPEDETATGPNFVREYILQLDVAPGQTIENVRLTDLLPPQLQFLSVTASNPAGAVTGTPQFLPGDNVLEFAFDDPIIGTAGVDATLTFEFFAGEFDSAGNPVLQPLDGSFVESINDVQAIFDWTPIDSRDPAVLDFVAGDLQTEDHILSLQSLAIQKQFEKIGPGTIEPGDTIEYRLDFQVSDYFSFDQIVVTDVLSDGQSIDDTFVPTLVFSDRVGGGSTTFQLGQDFTSTTEPDGSITIVFDVSAAMAGVVGQDGILQGGYTQGNAGTGATGQIVFRSNVDFEFRNPPVGAAPSVVQGDRLSNDVAIAGRVLDNDTLIPTAEVRTDDSGTSFSLITGSLSKAVYAVDGVPVTGPAVFTPGQVVTYRLTYELPKTRFQDLVLNDFLPLPVFDVQDADGLGGQLVWTDTLFTGTPGDLPTAGQIGYGPSATDFRDLYFVDNNLSPNVSTPAVGVGGNTFSVGFGTFDVLPEVTEIDLLFSIAAQDIAFADGLFLTNQAQAIESSTNATTSLSNTVTQLEAVGPSLHIIKGVVSTNRPDGIFEPDEPGGVIWGQPGSSTGFTGELTSSDLAADPGVDTDISGLDAGDRARFAIVIENRGGRAAFDTVFNDVIPAGFVVPADGLNFEVRTGDGTLLTSGVDYLVTVLPDAGDPSGFSFEVELLDEIGRGRDADLGTQVDDGSNVLVVTYDLELADNSVASTDYVNEVEITQYRGIAGDGANYAEAGFGTLTDDATVTTLSPSIAKALVGSSNPDTIGNDLAIGEIGTFTLTVTVPEGITGGLTVTDALPPGMQFVELVGVDDSSFVGTLDTTPIVTGGSGSGDDVTFAFGDVIATATTSGSQDNVFTITYTAQVMDVLGNVGTSLSNQTQLPNIATLTYDTLPPDVTIESETVVVNVVEPIVALTKSFSESVADAGDAVVVTLTLQNTGLAAAYDVVVTDDTLDFTKFDASSVTNLTTPAGFTFGFDNINGVITYTGDQIDAGETLQFQFEVVLLNTVLAGEALRNTATVTDAFSLPGDPGNDQIRDRAGAEDSASIEIATPTLDKQFLNGTVNGATSLASSIGADVVIGEQVTFDVLVTLPEGTTQSLRIIDNVPTGLRIDSLELVTLQAESDLLSADFTGTFGNTPTLGGPVIGGTPLTLDFGDVSVPGDNVAENNRFVVRLTATVINVLPNQENVSRTNTAELVFLDPDGPGNTGPASDVTVADSTPGNDPTVTVREPLLTVTKGASFTPPAQGGTEVTFTISISNSSSQTAYDVTLSDPIDDDFVVTPGIIPDSVVTVSGGATVSPGAFEFVDIGGGVFVLQTTTGAEINIPTGGSIQLVGEVDIRDDIEVATEIDNTANVRWTSLPGGLVGNDDGSIDERTGGDIPDTAPETLDPTSPAGPLNNYAISSGTVITLVSSIDAAKSFVESELNASAGQVVIGDLVTYQITVQMPEATAPELIIRDALPVGMAFVPGSIVLDASGFNGTVSAPAASPLVGTEFGNGTGVQFVFEPIAANVDDNPLTSVFTFTYQTVVLDVVSNVGTGPNPTVLTNTATHNNGGADPSFSLSAGGASVTVVEPDLQIDKSASILTGDAGDALSYTITVSHTGDSNWAAYDLLLQDILPDEFLPASFTAFIGATDVASSFDLTGQNFTTTGGVDLLLGQTLVINIAGELTIDAFPSQSIENTVSLSYTSYPGDRTAAGGFDPNPDVDTDRQRAYADSDSATVTILGATFDKLLFETSEVATLGSDVAIGETVTYALVVTLPEGTTPDLVIVDQLPPGMNYLSHTVVTDAAASGGLLIANFGGTVNAPVRTGGTGSGDDQTFNFNEIITDGDNNPDNNRFLLLVEARVNNELSNQQNVMLENVGTFNIESDGQPTFVSAPVTVTVVEPSLSVDKVILSDTSDVDGNDVIEFEITIGNTSGQTAFEVTLSDPIDSNLIVTAGVIPDSQVTVSGGASVSSGAFEFVDIGGGDFVLRTTAGADIDIPDNSSVTLVYSATVRPDVEILSTILNTANVRWSSLDGGLSGSDTGTLEERTGSGGAENDYLIVSPTTSFVTSGLSVQKSLIDTSLGGNDGLATIGELATYQMTVTLPEGTTPELVVRDAIPVGMAFVPGSVVVDDSGFNGTVPAPSITAVGGGGFLDGTDIEFVFTNVVTTADNDSTNNTFTFTYQTVVLDVGTNVGTGASPTVLNNTATYNNGLEGTGLDFSAGGASVTVVEPDLQIDKSASILTGDAGDALTYTITVSHTGDSNWAAYDLLLQDILPDEFLPASFTAFIGATDVASSFDLTGQNLITTGGVDLLLGQTLVINIAGELTIDAIPSQSIENTVSLSYTSYPGDRTAAGGFDPNPDVDTDRERAYADSDSATVTILGANFDKLLFETSEVATLGSDVAIGETVTYALVVTLPEGTTPDLVVVDQLPPGMNYLSHTVVTDAAASGGLLIANFGGTVNAPVRTGGTGSGDDQTFNFNEIITDGDNNPDNNRFLLLVEARVNNELSNQQNVMLENVGTFNIESDGQPIFVSDPVMVTVVEPDLEITKTILTPTSGVDAGDTVTYEIVVQHSALSSSDAFDLILSDTLPGELENLSIDSATIGATDVSGLFGLVGGELQTTGKVDLAQGSALTLRISGTVRDSVSAGTEISNAVTVSYTSLDGPSDEQRDGSDGEGGALDDYFRSADADDIITVGVLDVLKTADFEEAAIGELVTYTILVTVGEGTTVVSLSDTLPAGMQFVSGSSQLISNPAGMSISGLDANSVNQTLTVINPGVTDNAAAADSASFELSYEVIVSNTLGNQDGTALTNAIIASAANLPNAESSDTVTVVEPDLDITKSIVTPTSGVDAGDTVTYEIVVQHSAQSSSDAFDLILSDTLPGELENLAIDSATIGATDVSGLFGLVGGELQTTGKVDLVQGSVLTLRISGTVRDSISAGTEISNAVTVSYTSLDGPSDEQRDGSDGEGGALDDYFRSADADDIITVGVLDVLKTADFEEAAIGELVTYTILVTVGEGTTVVSLSDTLPAGMQFVSGSSQLVANPAGMSISGLDANSVNQTLTVINPGVTDNAAAADSASFELSYEVIVSNTLGNQDGTALTNALIASAANLPNAESSDTVTVVEPDLEITKTVDDSTPRLGQTVRYELIVRHSSDSTSDAFDLVAADTLPANLTLDLASVNVSSTGGASGFVNQSSGNTISFTVEQLVLGGEFTISYDAVVTTEIDQFGSINTNSAAVDWTSQPGENPNERTGEGGLNDYFDDTDVSITVFGPDLRVTKDNGETVLLPGEEYTYTIIVTNDDGPFSLTANNIIVVDEVPAGLTVVGTAGGDGAAVIDGQTVTFSLNSLDPGDFATFSITVSVDSPVAAGLNDIINTVSVAHDDIDPTPTDNTDTHPNSIDAVPDLVVTKSSSVDEAAPSDFFSYVITVENVGNQDATGVVLVDDFPSAVLLFVGASGGGVYDALTGQVTFDVGDLDAGQSLNFTIDAQVRPIVPPAFFDFTNVVIATDDGSGGPDPTPENNEDSTTIALPARPLLEIEKDDELETVEPGQIFTYFVTVQNTGNQGATGVQVVDEVPPELVFIEASNGGVFDPNTGEVTWDIGELLDNSSITLTLTVQVPADFRIPQTIFTNVVTVTDDGTNSPDGQPQEATDSDDTELFFFVFDFFNNLSHPTEWTRFDEPQFERLYLPVDPIFSGSADPGTTLEAVIYDDRGVVIGRRTVVTDAGGNWLMTFPSTIIQKQPHRIDVIQSSAAIDQNQDAGHNVRRHFHPALHGTLFFAKSDTVNSVMRNLPSVVLDSMSEVAARPVTTDWSLNGQDFRMSSVSPADR